MKFHPVASMFPLMEGAEFDALVSDIDEQGQLEPISLFEGMILDGRNRWRACQQLGLNPTAREWNGDDPEAFVVSLNLHRRHLTREQRNEIIRELRGNGHSIRQIAAAARVSVGTVHDIVSGVQFRTPDRIVGADGKSYPAQQEPKHVHVAQNSGNNEWYTPPEYIRAAWQTMGSVDLDPASSEIANRTVGAATFYTAEDNGLTRDWSGCVWMNPPYATPLVGQFADKLALYVKCGDVTEACVLVNNATETGWFNTILDLASCVCFIRRRIKFLDENGNPSGAPLQGQAVLYIGPNVARFDRAFSDFGTVLYARQD